MSDELKEAKVPEHAKQEQETKQPRLKKNGKPRMARGKFWGIIAIIVVIVGVAGAGMWKWHEQPSFCSTVCHIEAPYVENYNQPQNQTGFDKYGQMVSNTNAMMAVLHRETPTSAKPTILCVDCHEPNFAELASDGMNYVTGNYYMPRNERSLNQLMRWENKQGSQFCVNDSCHSYLMGQDGLVDYGKLETITQQKEFNPHKQNHEGLSYDCSNCHKGHRASVYLCTGCHEHENVELPAGWLNYQDGVLAYERGLKS